MYKNLQLEISSNQKQYTIMNGRKGIGIEIPVKRKMTTGKNAMR
jgi:hypothetical protein